MAIITDIVLQCKRIFSWHIHLGSGWLQSACALADEEHKWTAYPELNLKIWQHNLRAGLAALAVHCQTSIMWRPCTSAPRRMQCLSFFLVAFSYLLSSEVGSCIQCSLTVDPLYWPVGTNAKPCDKRSEMALFCGTRHVHTKHCLGNRAPRPLAGTRGLLIISEWDCKCIEFSHGCKIFLVEQLVILTITSSFFLSWISRRLQCGHIYIVWTGVFLNSVSAQGWTTGAWTSQMHGHKFVRGTVACRPRFIRRLAVKVYRHAW